MQVGSLVITASDLSEKVNVFIEPIAALNSFFVFNGTYGIIIEIGNPENGTYYGEVYMLFDNGKHGWVPRVHLKLIAL
jgi:hypothetical protein